MSTVQNFQQVRQDGKVIDEDFNLKKRLALGWQPSKIVAVQWESGAKVIQVGEPGGLSATVVEGREFVATLPQNRPPGVPCELDILRADGSLHLRLPPVQEINGRMELGAFEWFEAPRTVASGIFAVVIAVQRNSLQFQIDLDAATGKAVGVYGVR